MKQIGMGAFFSWGSDGGRVGVWFFLLLFAATEGCSWQWCRVGDSCRLSWLAGVLAGWLVGWLTS